MQRTLFDRTDHQLSDHLTFVLARKLFVEPVPDIVRHAEVNGSHPITFVEHFNKGILDLASYDVKLPLPRQLPDAKGKGASSHQDHADTLTAERDHRDSVPDPVHA
ncbi:MAG TPA: hypothetical protein VMP00_12540 [Burkholderiales bacterium]|nr:hypothetical protein [Burkholderiales bacterium]